MNARLTDRMRRAAEEATRQGFDALVVAPSPDLAYLTGYDPMPLERPTPLVLRSEHAPTMLVPELERPLAADCPSAGAIELIGWTDAVDPYAEAARLLPSKGASRSGTGSGRAMCWGSSTRYRASRSRPASPVIGRLRAVKDEDELAALRRAARGADEAFRTICTMPFAGRREEQIAADLADLLVRNGHSRADFTIVASGRTPPRRTTNPADARSCPGTRS